MLRKIFLFSFFGFVLFLNAYSQNSAKLSINMTNQTMKEFFAVMEQKYSYTFMYNNSEINDKQLISVKETNVTLDELLKKVFSNNGVIYEIHGKQILLKNSQSKEGANRQMLTGKVTDTKGAGLLGVNIVIRGTSVGTTSDENGNYSLIIPENVNNPVLQFTYLGFQKKEENIGNRNLINVILIEEATALNEVVVVGYGIQKRVNLTGAVSSVSSEVMQSKPVNNPLSALQGEMPGLVIQRYSGSPGDEQYSLNIRGISSTNGANAPLVIIDGVAGDINLLNPDDIESISVLKDAQAAIYGARAANGVFLVTTKKGKSGTPKISYSGNFAITKESGMMKSPTTYEMAIMDNEANIHNGAAPMYTPDLLQRILNNDPNPIDHPLYGGWKLFFTTTDWMKELLHNGFQQKHNLTISGGNDNSDYYLSGGYTDQRGVIRYADNGNKRYNLRFNYNYTFFKRVRLETKVVIDNQARTNIGGVGDWVIGEGIFDMPNHPIYNPQGNFFAQGGWDNSVAWAKEAATATYKIQDVNTNFKLVADIVPGLQLNLQAGINHRSTNDKNPGQAVPLYNWDNQIAYYSIANPETRYMTQANSTTSYRNYTGYLQYSKLLNKRHNLDVMLGLAHEENDFEKFSAFRQGFSDNGLWELDMGGTTNMTNEGRGDHWSINSGFGRLGYSFDSKYLLEANFRYDGSSRFSGADRRWGFFPGVSVGWRLSEESFIKKHQIFDDLKLRLSYGTTGNQEGIGLYDFIQKIKVHDNGWGTIIYYPFGAGSLTKSLYLDGMVSQNRTWETIINKNIGLDGTLLHSRLNFSLDYFNKNNNNMLIPVTYPSLLGTTAPSSNSGNMIIKGFEVSLGWKDKIGSVTCFVKATLSDAQNKVTHYGGMDTYKVGDITKIRESYPINSYFGYVFDGLIRNQAELDAYKKLDGVPSNIGIGDARFKDLNNDGKISAYGDGDDGDMKFLGSTTPRYTYGITVGGKYRGFDCSIFFQGVGQRTLFRTGDYSIPWTEWWRQPPEFYYLQTWNEDRPDAYYPRLSYGDIRWWNYQMSTLQKINAAYIRLKNIQIGYSLPGSLIQKAHISNVRIYLSGQDIWEHHKVKGGWDPESADWGGNYPFQRYYSLGLDVTF